MTPPETSLAASLRRARRRARRRLAAKLYPARGKIPSSGVELARDVHVAVHVRQHAEVPDEAGALDAPEVPLAFLRRRHLEEAKMQLLEATVGLDDLHDLVGVLLAERRQDRAH